MTETITQEAVLERVRQRLGELDAKAEQAVAHALAVLDESRKGKPPEQATADEFVSANVSLAQYEAWSSEERFQYLKNAKKVNAGWIKKRFAALGAAWLMVIDGKVIVHGASIQQLPKEQEFDALCEKHGKYPFVFFSPRNFMIEETSTWHTTIEPDDAYPTVPIKLRGARRSLDMVADFDTGAHDAYFDFDLLLQNRLLKQGSRDYEDESVHLGQSFRFTAKPLRLSLKDKTGKAKEIGIFAFCIKNWADSPFVAINPNRSALVGRALFFKLGTIIHLNFVNHLTEIGFPPT
jgi:hypothetical protein